MLKQGGGSEAISKFQKQLRTQRRDRIILETQTVYSKSKQDLEVLEYRGEKNMNQLFMFVTCKQYCLRII